MLSEEKNRLLTRVGPGEPMGDYLRRYWLPIGGAAELDANPVKPIRILGEDLVLYRDLSGTYGLTERNCLHRRADLSYGFVEKKGLRCNYHGWLFDEGGACIERPYDDLAHPQSRNAQLPCIKAYPVKELAGLLFAYMGPKPAPELPVYEPFTRTDGFAQVVTADIPCNWFQCQENSCDPVHFEWMHDNWSLRLAGKDAPYAAKHLRVAFDEFEHGFTYKRMREGATEDDPLWQVGRVTLWPIGFFLGQHFEWRVPVDDENTLSIAWFYMRVPQEQQPYVQKHVPAWKSPIVGPDGRWISTHVINQDIIAWVGQGTIADRTKEVLGASDRGISMIRKRFLDDLESVAAGNDPKGTIRDPEAAKCIPLPSGDSNADLSLSKDEMMRNPYFRARLTQDFRWHAGQPKEVRKAFLEAMGAAEQIAKEGL